MEPLHVLMVDNSVAHRSVMEHSMQETLAAMPGGGAVEVAPDVDAAESRLRLFHPNVVTVNFGMSVARAHGKPFIPWLVHESGVPVVAYGLSSVLRPAAKAAGAEAFFLRPTRENDWSPFCSKLARFLRRLAFPAEKPELLLPEKAAHKSAPLRLYTSEPGSRKSGHAHHQAEERALSARRLADQITRQRSKTPPLAPAATPAAPAPAVNTSLARIPAAKNIELIAIGASTGGTDALSEIITHLSPALPPIVIVQHIPPVFSRLFAERLNGETKLVVQEAKEGDMARPNHVYIAPGDYHMLVAREGGRLILHLTQTPKVHSVRPSVDVLFESVARNIGASALGVILTGMGKDGAAGLLRMRQQGSPTIGQDEASCVVYGMPGAAFEAGAVEHQLPLTDIAPAILRLVGR